MRTLVVMLAGALAGCGNVGSKQSDAGAPAADATPPDASTVCDPTGTFDPAVPVAGLNTGLTERLPRLTADELELYFDDNAGGTDVNIYRAQRSGIDQAFSAPSPVTVVNTTGFEAVPSVSSDGRTLFFHSSRVTGEGVHLYVTTRTSRIGEFNAPSEAINVNSSTVTDTDGQPFLTADSQELWFTSTRTGGLGGLDVYRATWNGSSFANVLRVPELSTTAGDNFPTLSADKLTVYLSSDRPTSKGGLDIWTANRSTVHDGFPMPTPVAELNTTGNEAIGWISADNCRIYLSSDIAGTNDIYVASRHPM